MDLNDADQARAIVPHSDWRLADIDIDPAETQEWIDSLDSLVKTVGPARATFLIKQLLQHARLQRVPISQVLVTPYCNTIGTAQQAMFPGNLEIESRISAMVRWNALAMVVRANRVSAELGGHIASYASAADLFEVGFNHFFRAGQRGDLVFFQPHSSPGVYARAYLEGRLDASLIGNYRRESGANADKQNLAVSGLSSYPHPWLMPDFWQFPTGSMGLGPLFAIYQARFLKYLQHRGLLDPESNQDRKVWSFVGDGEMDEPESLAGLSIAAREGLDNLVMVVNCNLQRLDGPVRGNGSIIQELEGMFAGAGWNVIKLLWGSEWDSLFERDSQQSLLRRLHETVDGEFQQYAATDGRFNREHFFNKYPELQHLVAHLSDEDINRLRRGGHDPVKIYAAYKAAVQHKGQPTVILAKTKKGYGMGTSAQGRMTTHQQKKLDTDALLEFRDRFGVPLTDEQVENCEFLKPADASAEMRYLHAQRANLGGYLPHRIGKSDSMAIPPIEQYASFAINADGKEMSTTMAFVRMLSSLLKDKTLGKRIVPIIADEARTFGMADLFRQIGIYAPMGQLYEPEDREQISYYKEARDGQILEEGINEAAAIASWVAAGTSYSVHGLPMLPFYIFYSMFGFQRVGDLIWAAADSRTRGFLLGATAGRTTLSGEGLQHEDGTSHLIASTIPNCRAYDPCFAYELATIVDDGMRRMMMAQEDVFYYVTVMNENYPHPSATVVEGEGETTMSLNEGILRGIYLFRRSEKSPARLRLLGAGTILREVIVAAEMLESEFEIAIDIFSVTSFTELRREAMTIERENRLSISAPPQKSWIERQIKDTGVPVIAASDYVRAVADMIRPWVKASYVTLGTDGFGRSDTRKAIREFFEVDRHSIVVAALDVLSRQGSIKRSVVSGAIEKYGLENKRPAPWVR